MQSQIYIKCDILTQLYLSGKLSIPEAILWLYDPTEKRQFVDDDDDQNMTNETDGQMDLVLNLVQALDSIHKLKWSEIQKAGNKEDVKNGARIDSPYV